MEDEVLRLQGEWAVVLQEIQRASEENLILKDILKCQPPLSCPTSTPTPTPTFPSSSHPTNLSKPMAGRQCPEAAFVRPEDDFQPIINTSHLSPSTCMSTLTPSSDFTSPVPTNGHPNAEGADAFTFFTAPSQLRQCPGEGYLRVQYGPAEEVDGRAYSLSSSNTSSSHPQMPSPGHYGDLNPYLTPNNSVHSVRQAYTTLRRDDNDGRRTATPEYFDMAGFAPLGGDDLNPASGSTGPNNYRVDVENSLPLKVEPDGDCADGLCAAPSVFNHPEYRQAANWW